MNNLTKLCSCVIVGSAMMLSACGGSSVAPYPDYSLTNDELLSYIKKSQWTLDEAGDIKGVKISALTDIKNQVKLSFDNANNQTTFEFNVGCNTNSGGYSLSGDNLFSAQQVMSTQQFCAELDTAENVLEQFFRKDVQFRLYRGKDDNPQTLLMDADGKMLAWHRTDLDTQSPENKALLKQLTKYSWQLIESTDAKIQTNLDISASVNSSFLSFANADANNLSYSMGCNNYRGDFTLEENATLSSSKINNTEKACNPTLMTAEESLNQLIQKGSNLAVAPLGSSTKYPTLPANTPIMTQTINNVTNNDGTKPIIKWRGVEKTYTATVVGVGIPKRIPGVVHPLKEQTEVYNNVTIPDAGFCDDTNIYKYGFLHQNLSNMFQKTCNFDGLSNVNYRVFEPNSGDSYKYEITLTENLPNSQ